MSDFAKLLEMALSIQPEPQRTVTREDGVMVNTRNPLVGEWPGGHEEAKGPERAPAGHAEPAHTAMPHPHAEPPPAPRPGPRK
jgi:hypothetical protein